MRLNLRWVILLFIVGTAPVFAGALGDLAKQICAKLVSRPDGSSRLNPADKLPLKVTFPPLEQNPFPLAGLVTSETEHPPYAPYVEGTIPRDLKGTLYRNGPGRFDRGGLRRRSILDGDGLIQAFRFESGQVTYHSRFVRTKKFVEEEAAGRFLYPTWTTLSPAGFRSNLLIRLGNQAGVTVYRHGDKLLAMDESHTPYVLNPHTLETLSPDSLNAQTPDARYHAHRKVDSATGDVFFFMVEPGKNPKIRITEMDRDLKVKQVRELSPPRFVYLHDWSVTKDYFVFILHPAFASLPQALKMLAGRQTVSDSIQYRPADGNVVWVVPRHGGEAKQFSTDAAWVWHTLNAFDTVDGPVVDFVGDTAFPGVTGATSPFGRMAAGLPIDPPRGPTSFVRRYVIDMKAGKLRAETPGSDGHYEFPYVNPHLSCQKHRYGYFCRRDANQLFYTSLVRLRPEDGAQSSYRFFDGEFITEPVFVPKSGARYSGTGAEPGWVMTEVYDSAIKLSYLAILDAEHLAGGPVAKVWLTHHVPLTFHGTWHPE